MPTIPGQPATPMRTPLHCRFSLGCSYVASVDPLPWGQLLPIMGGSDSERQCRRARSSSMPAAWPDVRPGWAHPAQVEAETSSRDGPVASILAPGDRIVALNCFLVEKPEDVTSYGGPCSRRGRDHPPVSPWPWPSPWVKLRSRLPFTPTCLTIRRSAQGQWLAPRARTC